MDFMILIFKEIKNFISSKCDEEMCGYGGADR
jgi:hypothetical protein